MLSKMQARRRRCVAAMLMIHGRRARAPKMPRLFAALVDAITSRQVYYFMTSTRDSWHTAPLSG